MVLSKKATIIYNVLKADKQGFIPSNMYIKGLTRKDNIEGIKELFEKNLVKFRECIGSAIELT